jgi:serine/threonine protein kinase
VSEEAKDLITKLLVKSADIRLTAVEALNHPYLLQALT